MTLFARKQINIGINKLTNHLIFRNCNLDDFAFEHQIYVIFTDFSIVSHAICSNKLRSTYRNL